MPFVAFLAAEAIGASGVLAVVVAGLVVSQVAPKLDRAETRQQTRSFWSFATFLLNGSLFVLVGIEATIAMRDLEPRELLVGLGMIGLVSVAVVVLRFAFLNLSWGAVRLVTLRTGGSPREGHRDRVVSGFTGFRGAVSLAAAVAVPRMVEGGGAFPERDLIVFVVAGVVIVTIVGQSLVLPAVVRWADFGGSHEVADERRTAERRALEEALDGAAAARRPLGRRRRRGPPHPRGLRGAPGARPGRAERRRRPPAARERGDAVELELELVRLKAATLIRMRDEGDIDDLVLRQVRAEYDAEETRLLRQGERD